MNNVQVCHCQYCEGYRRSKERLAAAVEAIPKYVDFSKAKSQNEVYWRVMDSDGNFLNSSGYTYNQEMEKKGYRSTTSSACFASLHVEKQAERIILFHPIEKIPYTEQEVVRWVADLNEMGFICSYLGQSVDGWAYFEIPATKDTPRLEWFATLNFLRNLFEVGSCFVPELYFTAMDANPEADKFEEIQKAHKYPVKIKGILRQVGGHAALSYMMPEENVTKEEFWKRMKSPEGSQAYGLNALFTVQPVNKEQHNYGLPYAA